MDRGDLGGPDSAEKKHTGVGQYTKDEDLTEAFRLLSVFFHVARLRKFSSFIRVGVGI